MADNSEVKNRPTPITRVYQKDEAMTANQIGHGESLSRLVVQIDHLRANRIEDVVGLVELRGSKIVAEFELQPRHAFNEFVLVGYSHGVDPSGSDRAFVGPAYPFGGTQVRRKELVCINRTNDTRMLDAVSQTKPCYVVQRRNKFMQIEN